MLQKFLTFSNNLNLFSASDKVLLAVSGGIDSVTMVYLFKEARLDISVAHCNFGLRGSESDEDEKFVENLAKELQIPFFVKHFKTGEYADLQKLSIQMAARELRYNWFENLSCAHKFTKIAIAHNTDDSIETFFINLIRGTGIQGITGIKPLNGKIIRPLLCFTRKEIEQYCIKKSIEYRIDSSNLTTKYLRNKIRHDIIPLFEECNTEFKSTMNENLSRFAQVENIFEEQIQKIKTELVTINDANTFICIEKLLKTKASETVLYEILKQFEFSSKTCEEVFRALNNTSGTVFYSNKYRVIKDRQNLIISLIKHDDPVKYYIQENLDTTVLPIQLKFELKENTDFKIPLDQNIACIDADKLSFPLILRKWKNGDYFTPFGMVGLKKVSDFFVDKKLSLLEKENTWILADNDKIIWIVGQRIDNYYRIKAETKKIFKIEYIKNQEQLII